MAFPILGPIIIAGTGAFITWFFQRESASREHERDKRQAELQRANELFEELSDVMDSFSDNTLQVVWALILRPDKDNDWIEADHIAWKLYLEQRNRWEASSSRRLAQIKGSFGVPARDKWEDIQKDVEVLQRKVNATYFGRTDSPHFLSPDVKKNKSFFRYWRRFNKNKGELCELMIDKIQNEQVGPLN